YEAARIKGIVRSAVSIGFVPSGRCGQQVLEFFGPLVGHTEDDCIRKQSPKDGWIVFGKYFNTVFLCQINESAEAKRLTQSLGTLGCTRRHRVRTHCYYEAGKECADSPGCR